MKIYVASSWRNQYQPEVVATLRAVGHEVYDFKNPRPGGTETNVSASYQGAPLRVFVRDSKGGDPAEWPDDLRVREWPGEAR